MTFQPLYVGVVGKSFPVIVKQFVQIVIVWIHVKNRMINNNLSKDIDKKEGKNEMEGILRFNFM